MRLYGNWNFLVCVCLLIPCYRIKSISTFSLFKSYFQKVFNLWFHEQYSFQSTTVFVLLWFCYLLFCIDFKVNNIIISKWYSNFISERTATNVVQQNVHSSSWSYLCITLYVMYNNCTFDCRLLRTVIQCSTP